MIPPATTSNVLQDVLAERMRQITAEGWTPSHDDSHGAHVLLLAATCYAMNACNKSLYGNNGVPFLWPFGTRWWKPSTPRRDMQKAAALLVAAMERHDRLASKDEALLRRLRGDVDDAKPKTRKPRRKKKKTT